MKNKKVLIAAIALVVVIGTLLGVWLATRPKTQDGMKSFTVTVVHQDKTEKTFTYETDAQKLGSMLEQEGLIIGSGDGMFHTVDNEKADWSENQSYWAFYVGDDYAVKGIYDTDIEEGAQYKLVYTLG